MSTTLSRRPLRKATEDAEAFRALFPASTYERWEIAGSIRRGRPEVGDVEHVIVPRFGAIQITLGLFAESQTVNLLWHHLDGLVRAGTVAPRPTSWAASSSRPPAPSPTVGPAASPSPSSASHRAGCASASAPAAVALNSRW